MSLEGCYIVKCFQPNPSLLAHDLAPKQMYEVIVIIGYVSGVAETTQIPGDSPNKLHVEHRAPPTTIINNARSTATDIHRQLPNAAESHRWPQMPYILTASNGLQTCHQAKALEK
jgi:hypothetical protein